MCPLVENNRGKWTGSKTQEGGNWGSHPLLMLDFWDVGMVVVCRSRVGGFKESAGRGPRTQDPGVGHA